MTDGLVTTHEVAERLGVEPDSFRQWAKHRGIRPKGNRARTQLWDWDEIDEHDPPEADGKVRYECRKCGRPRTGHFVPDACPSCVWRSLHQPTTEGEGFRQPAVYCTECGKPTKYGKPLCSDHVEQMPYVKWLLEQLAD